jgi:CheY-like chemotaxis protein
MKKIILSTIVFFISFSLLGQSIDELKKKYEENKAAGNTNQVTYYLNKIAYHYWNNNQLELAAKNYEELLSISRSKNNTAAIRNVQTNLGLVYSDLSQYDKALNSFNESLKIAKNQNDKPATASAYMNIAVVNQTAGNNHEALSATENALRLAQELNQMKLVRSCYGMLADIHKKLGNTEETMKYFNLYASFDKHLKEKEVKQIKEQTQLQVNRAEADKQKTQAELSQERIKLQATTDTLRKEKEINRMQKEMIAMKEREKKQMEAQLRSEAIIRYLLLGIAIIVLAFAFFIFQQVKKTKKANVQLAYKNKEIASQRDEIQKQSEKIRASIQYAQRIQSAVLPPEETFEKYMNDYFVLFKPRDIVSGDFYWMTEKNEKLIIAVADCTGHGVPGAFMSMLGIAFLNEIVNKIIENKHVRSLQASEILINLREYVIKSLHQKGNVHEAKDGMDISLVVIDKKTGELQYSGANNPLYLIRDEEMHIFAADQMSISYGPNTKEEFTNHSIDTRPDDVIYLCSDGYQDQFGGSLGRKFMVKRFKSMLLEIHKLGFDKQKHVLDRTIMEWKKGNAQVDDMLVMGIKMNFKEHKKESNFENIWANKKVLIAEDTEANYLYLVEALRKTEVKILRARNGIEAIDLVKEHSDIDLVLMDINMPDMDGFEATELIKEHNRKLPIVAQTALNISEVETKAKQAGCDDIIYKPVKLKLFLKIIGKFLN